MAWKQPTAVELDTFFESLAEDTISRAEAYTKKINMTIPRGADGIVQAITTFAAKTGLLKQMVRIMTSKEIPRIYVFGEHNSGKSSVINALTGANVALVSSKPAEAQEGPHVVPARSGVWHVYDRRGIGEARADGKFDKLVDDYAKEVRGVKPHLILFVINGTAPHATKNETEALRRILKAAAKGDKHIQTKVVCVINRIDQHGSGLPFPLQDDDDQSHALIQSACTQFATDVIGDEYEYLDSDRPSRGLVATESKQPFRLIIPTCALSEEEKPGFQWNIDTLREQVLSQDVVADSAALAFAGGSNAPPKNRRALAERVRNRFSVQMSLSGSIPILDLVLVGHFERCMVGLIGRLGDHDLDLDSVEKSYEEIAGKSWAGKVRPILGSFGPLGEKLAQHAAERAGKEAGERASVEAVKKVMAKLGEQIARLTEAIRIPVGSPTASKMGDTATKAGKVGRGLGILLAVLVGTSLAGLQLFYTGTHAIQHMFAPQSQ